MPSLRWPYLPSKSTSASAIMPELQGLRCSQDRKSTAYQTHTRC